MRRLPTLQEGRKQNRMTSTFKGYNRHEIISDGEMYWTKNLSGDAYPAVSPRKKRGIVSFDIEGQDPRPLTGIFGLEGLVHIRGNYVYYKGNYIGGITVSTEETMLPKQIVGFGAYVCIWPDMVYFSTIDDKDKGSMERRWAAKDHVTETAQESTPPVDAPFAMMCRADGTDYDQDEITISDTAPADPDNGDLWLDTSGEDDVLRQYSSVQDQWVEVPTTYIKITGNAIGKGLSTYDTVKIGGLEAHRSSTQTAKQQTQLQALNGDKIIYDCGDDYIIIAGLINGSFILNHNTLEVNRELPDLDYVCVSNNRIWGCKYGTDRRKERKWTGISGNVRANLCDSAGNVYNYSQDITQSATPPANPVDGDLWMDISDYRTMTAHLKKYGMYGSGFIWYDVNTYVKLSATDIGKGLIKGDKIQIKGLFYNDTGYINPWIVQQIPAMNGTKEIVKAGNDYIVIKGIINYGNSSTGGWPCGDEVKQANVDRINIDTFVNEIKASKLGDFKNWNSYMGLSTDSYTAGVGTEGEFTGAVIQWGYPIFFKEKCIHRISGNTPGSFQVQTTMCEGVQKGSWRSIKAANEVVYYKARHDVMGYDGNMPVSISEKLGDLQYEDARAGVIGSKYYISMKNGEEWNHFCYDTKKGIWYREDNLKALGYAADGDELYAIDEENNTLIGLNGSIFNNTANGQYEEGMEWEAVFGISGIEYADSMYGAARTDSRNRMYMSRFDIRMYLEDGAEANLWIMYDDDGEWRHQGKIKGTKTGSFMLPVIPRRCDHMRVKLTGTGDFRLYSISRIMEEGNDG